jgi:hypothetical protein
MKPFYLHINVKTKGADCILKLMCLILKAFAFLQRLKCKLFRQKTINITCYLKTGN